MYGRYFLRTTDVIMSRSTDVKYYVSRLLWYPDTCYGRFLFNSLQTFFLRRTDVIVSRSTDVKYDVSRTLFSRTTDVIT